MNIGHRRQGLVFEANLLFQRVDAEASSSVVVDERTTLRVYGSGEATFTEGFIGNLSASYQWSWPTFNLKLGLGYGHFSLPLVNFFFPIAFQHFQCLTSFGDFEARIFSIPNFERACLRHRYTVFLCPINGVVIERDIELTGFL